MYEDWESPKHLRNAILYLASAAIVYGISMAFVDSLTWYWKLGFSGLIVSLLVAAGWSFVKDFTRHLMLAYRAKKEADAITDETAYNESMKGLPTEAFALLEHKRSDLILDMKGGNPVYLIRTLTAMDGYLDVPSDFAESYMQNCDEISLEPVNHYNGLKRTFAQAIVQHCVNNKWAVGSAGNQAARWNPAGKSRAMRGMKLDKLRELK
jgi:hypothetical protein